MSLPRFELGWFETWTWRRASAAQVWMKPLWKMQVRVSGPPVCMCSSLSLKFIVSSSAWEEKSPIFIAGKWLHFGRQMGWTRASRFPADEKDGEEMFCVLLSPLFEARPRGWIGWILARSSFDNAALIQHSCQRTGLVLTISGTSLGSHLYPICKDLSQILSQIVGSGLNHRPTTYSTHTLMILSKS